MVRSVWNPCYDTLRIRFRARLEPTNFPASPRRLKKRYRADMKSFGQAIPVTGPEALTKKTVWSSPVTFSEITENGTVTYELGPLLPNVSSDRRKVQIIEAALNDLCSKLAESL